MDNCVFSLLCLFLWIVTISQCQLIAFKIASLNRPLVASATLNSHVKNYQQFDDDEIDQFF